MTATVTDLFSGVGGSSLGAEMAGATISLAMNHWQTAIDVHQAHFPDARHDCADISQADPRRYPRTDILIASPECTNHSQARGISRKAQDASLFDSADLSAERSRADDALSSLPNPLFDIDAPQSLDKDERYTPAWVFDGLGLTFDLDPASPGPGGGDVVPTLHQLTKADDGLAHRWHGLVWLNPPFSNCSAWARRFIDHGNGVFLGPIANAQWAHEMMSVADLFWLCRDFPFTHPTHSGKRSSMPLFFAAMGRDAAIGLSRLARSARHAGVLMVRAA